MYVAAVGIETAPVWPARLWQVKQNCVLFYCNETMGRGNFNNVWNGVVINAPAKKK
uniref:Orf99 n=3 Tax=Serratia TaxID=613 RepID=A0A7S6YLT6_SERMA|nr:Orf99 [Serratia marcescens]